MPEEIVLDQCPQCESIFDYSEIDSQKCSCCGWEALKEETKITLYALSNLKQEELKVILGALVKEKQSMQLLMNKESTRNGFIKQQLLIIQGLINTLEKYSEIK